MADALGSGDGGSEKTKRREARELIAAYHQEQLRALLEHVRVGFAQLASGEIDEFELDDLIHRYKRAAAQLWKFCQSRHLLLGAASRPRSSLTTCRTARLDSSSSRRSGTGLSGPPHPGV